MKKYILPIVIICITFFQLSARIIETSNFDTIYSYIRQDSLVAFDIDNTLAHQEYSLGTDEWFCYMVDQNKKHGYADSSAIYLALPLAYYAQFNLPLVLTDPQLPSLFDYLKKEGINVMGVTARGLFLAERTYEQLKNIGLTFLLNINKPEKKEFIIPMPLPCMYKYGTLFCSSNPKGKTLLAFFELTNYHPSHIVFVDDKMYHVQDVDATMAAHNIECISIRYSGCDDRVKNFNPSKAESELLQLQKINRVHQ